MEKNREWPGDEANSHEDTRIKTDLIPRPERGGDLGMRLS